MNFRYQLIIIFALFTSSVLTAQNSYAVNFKGAEYQPQENISTFDPQEIDQEEIISNNFYRFIQFNNALKKEEIAVLEERGINLLSYVPAYTYLASISKDINKSDLIGLNIRSIWEVQMDQKLSEDVQNRSLPDWSLDGQEALLLLEYYKNLDQELVIQLLKKNNIEVIRSNGINNFLQISIPLDRLEELQELPFLQSVSPKPAPAVKDDRR